MVEFRKKTSAARQVELVMRKLGSLSTLPEVALAFLPYLDKEPLNISALTEIIESDPALTAKILALACEEGVTFGDNKPSVAEVLSRLPGATIRNAVLSVKIFQAFDVDYDPDSRRALPRKKLALHELAVACCSKFIAKLILPASEQELAFSAGLLHDIGKLAIDEVMPKSFERIVAQAQAEKVSMLKVEQKHLGLDHTIIGKRLAEKWSLPEEVVFAIWLHHSDIESIKNMPGGKIAQIVHLADIIARQCKIGVSGSFDTPVAITDIAASIGISPDQIDTIRTNLSEEVSRRVRALGLDMPGASQAYCSLVHETATDLSSNNIKLSESNRKLQIDSSQAGFVNEFLLSIEPNISPGEIVANFAAGWQKNYQTGPVCVYIKHCGEEGLLETVVVDESREVKTLLINVPEDTPIVPTQLYESFKIVDAGEEMEWLFDQIKINFDLSRTKLAPLAIRGKVIGGIVFEHRLPSDPADYSSQFEEVTSIAARIIGLTFTSQNHELLAEEFAMLLGELKDTREQLARSKSLIAIAEMAAGAGHELNTPLAVISGRAQLLYEAETDEDKKKILKQVQQRTEDIAEIISDLMSFASPKEPVRKNVSLRELFDIAIVQTAEIHKVKSIEVDFQGIDQLGEVCVDSQQVVRVLVNILSNSLESYAGGSGPISILAAAGQREGFAAIEIIDNGCGMDDETLQKATEPFYSARPAGRKRGMGLAHAERLLTLNAGSLHFSSKVDGGTTVTVKLPRS